MSNWEEHRKESQLIRRSLIPLAPEIEHEIQISDECDRWLKSDEVSEYIFSVAEKHPIAMEDAFIAGWQRGCKSMIE